MDQGVLVCRACPKGSDMSLYFNTSSDDVPVWNEHCGIVEDLDINEVEEVQELTGRRDDRQVKEYNEGEIELSITGTEICDPLYHGWIILNSARNGGAPVDIAVLTGDISTVGSYGWRGMFWNSDRTQRGPAAGNLTSSFNLQPSAPCLDPYERVRTVQIVSPADGLTIPDIDATDILDPVPLPV